MWTSVHSGNIPSMFSPLFYASFCDKNRYLTQKHGVLLLGGGGYSLIWAI